MTQAESVRIATCQFPVTQDITANLNAMESFVVKAKGAGAHLVHFCEGALSGYGGSDFFSWDDFDWPRLKSAGERLQELAHQHGIWIIAGSAHPVAEGIAPTNCVYVIGPDGTIQDRYDKRMLTDGDQLFYTAGDHFVTFTVHGVKLGLLICYDGCFPEMYAAYRDQGVQVMLHSFNNAGFMDGNILDEIGPAWIRVRAADNKMWVVANNSSRAHQSWPSCVARPDGSLAKSCTQHEPGMLIHDFPDDELKGWLHNHKPMKLHPQEVFGQGVTSNHVRVSNRQAPP